MSNANVYTLSRIFGKYVLDSSQLATTRGCCLTSFWWHLLGELEESAFTFTVSEDEFNQIKQKKAGTVGLGLSEYLRRSGLNQRLLISWNRKS